MLGIRRNHDGCDIPLGEFKRTHSIKDTLTPKWDETFALEVNNFLPVLLKYFVQVTDCEKEHIVRDCLISSSSNLCFQEVRLYDHGGVSGKEGLHSLCCQHEGVGVYGTLQDSSSWVGSQTGFRGCPQDLGTQ